MKRTGAKVFVECLEKEGVEVIFGYPGGAVLDIYDVLYDSSIKHIMTRHEQAAAHAADGYARASGKVGVCLATSGPGATNLVTGIATAYMDSIPIVAFTGQVPVHLIGNDAFQEADTVGITRSVTKHNYLVKDVDELPRIVKEAFYIAKTGRPGPVLVDLPKNILQATTKEKYPNKVHIRGYNPTYKGHKLQLNRAADAILMAKKPVLYTGGGIISSEASEELLKLVELTKIPVTTTLMGLGGFPETHPLSLGMLGMHGTWYANMVVTHSDLIIAVGARFDDRITGKIDAFAPGARVIHIDIDPSAISKNIKVDVPIVGDAKLILSELIEVIKEKMNKYSDRDISSWLEQIKEWKEKYPLRYEQKEGELKPQFVVEEIYRVTEGNAIITTEVGQNQMWAAQFYKFTKPRTFISSGGLGTMGYGFPAAIGAQLAKPHAIVFDIAGDGSFQMNSQELATVVQYNIPVKVAILNNSYLGMVRQWQQLFYHRRYSSTSLEVSPDFVKLAEAYGAVGIRVEKPDEAGDAVKRAIETPGPVIMDFIVTKEENVFPMVPAGAPIEKMLLV